MVTAKQNKDRTASRGHVEQSTVGEDIIEESARTVKPSDFVLLGLRVAIEDAQIKIAACVIDHWVTVACVKDTVDYEVRERKEQARDTTRVRSELLVVATKKSLEDELRVWKDMPGYRLGAWDRASIGSACHTHSRNKRIII
jgi:hypothetical protein